MPQRQFGMPGKKAVRTAQTDEARPKQEQPEMDRYLVQVDRQTKRSFKTAEAARSAALEIKPASRLFRSPFMMAQVSHGPQWNFLVPRRSVRRKDNPPSSFALRVRYLS